VLGVELGDAFDGLSIAPRVEIDDFLVRVLEWENDGVGWEGREGWVEFLGDVLEVLGGLLHCAHFQVLGIRGVSLDVLT
jgi:hypothetical protein